MTSGSAIRNTSLMKVMAGGVVGGSGGGQTAHPVIAAFTDHADNNVRFLAGREEKC